MERSSKFNDLSPEPIALHQAYFAAREYAREILKFLLAAFETIVRPAEGF